MLFFRRNRIMKAAWVLVLGAVFVFFLIKVRYSTRMHETQGLAFRVADFGAKGDGVADDSAAIRSAIAAAMQSGKEATVLFDAKRYRVSANPAGGGKYCFHLSEAKNVTLRGVPGRTELLSSNPHAGMFGFFSCKDVKLKGVVIDYEQAPFIQGSIVAIDAARGSFDFKVDDGYPEPQPELMKQKWGVVMNRKARCFKPGTPSCVVIRSFTPLGNRVWRMELKNLPDAGMLAVGDAFVMRGPGDGNAVTFSKCNGASVEDVTIHASPGLCMGFIGCEGDLVVRRVTVRPRPDTTRLLAGNVDGIHCQMARKGLLVEGCHFEGMTDDGMNTYDRVRMVTEVISPSKIRVHQTFDMRPGDRIQVMDPRTGFVKGEAGVSTVADNVITLDKPIDGVRTSKEILKGIISMDNHLDADVVYNLSTCGAGYIIRNNYFGNFRGRGLILRGVNGLIENNVFERTSGPGIVIANEPHWPEGPMPRDIVIRGNQLRGVGLDAQAQNYGAIMVMGLGLNGISPAPAVKNVRIENNLIMAPPAEGISLLSCDGVTVSGNRIDSDASRTFSSGDGLGIRACRGVVVSELTINDTRPNTAAGIVIGESVAPGEAGVQISGLHANLPAAAKPVLDRREKQEPPHTP